MDKKILGTHKRTESMTLDRERANREARTIPVSISSDAPVQMPYGLEILEHTQDAIDMTRTAGGLMMLWNHDRAQPVGKIHDLRIEGGKWRGMAHFSNNQKAREVFDDVADGFLSDTSISYDVLDYEETKDGIRVTRWMPKEGSIVTVPADPSVGVNRSEKQPPEGQKMKYYDKEGNEIAAPEQPKAPVLDFTEARKLALAEGVAEGQRREQERQDGIRSLFTLPAFDKPVYKQLEAEAIRQLWTVEQAREKMLDLIGQGTAPVVSPGQRDGQSAAAGRVEAGADEIDKFRGAVEVAVGVRAGVETDKEKVAEANAGPYRAMSLIELGREYLHKISVNTNGMSRRELAGAVFARSLIAHGTDDFVNILANVAEKSALMGFTEAPETWSTWARAGSLSDFKSSDRSGLGEFADLDLVYENGEYKFATMSDRKESLQLATYGKKFSLSRQAIINDDLNEFTTIPRKMGRAAARKIGDLAYAVLTSNPTLAQDSTALFDASGHANYVASGSGAAPSVATLNAGFAAMKKQKDNDSHAHGLNIIPQFLIVPVALEATAQALAVNQYDPAGTAGTLPMNPYNGRITVVADPRLDEASATAWYLAANGNLNDTVEVAFLDGQQTPYLEQVEGGGQDGVVYKVRIDAVAGPLAYQGLYMNYGA